MIIIEVEERNAKVESRSVSFNLRSFFNQEVIRKTHL